MVWRETLRQCLLREAFFLPVDFYAVHSVSFVVYSRHVKDFYAKVSTISDIFAASAPDEGAYSNAACKRALQAAMAGKAMGLAGGRL